MTSRPLPRRALYEEVAEQLRSRILAHEMHPGSWIDEQALCAQLGISRTPLREALKVLASEGLDPARTRTLVLHGDPAASVLEREQAEDCDLVAIGKHGEGGMQAWLLGGVAKHVLANARGDVLLAT